jgi:hypothetical protein
MLKLLSRRPSAAMLVAMTALVSSLAGPAAADQVARIAQSVTGDQVRDGSITGSDIRNESVTGSDIRNGSLTTQEIGTGQVHTSDLGDNAVRGDKIQANTIDSSDLQNDALRGEDVFDNTLTGNDIAESTLGKVPSAARADGAASVDTEIPIRRVTAAVGQDVTLATFGPFTLQGNCSDEFGEERGKSADRAVTYSIATSQDDAAVDGFNDEDADFDAEDGFLQIGDFDGSSGDDSSYTMFRDRFAASAAAGGFFWGQIAQSTNKFGADCAWEGIVQTHPAQ